MVARGYNCSARILQRFIELSTAGDNRVDNLKRPPKIPIFSSQAHNRSGSLGIFP
jgi:hypothetical protein